MAIDDRRTMHSSEANQGPDALDSVRKRDGRSVPFDRHRIAHAIEMAFRAEIGIPYPDPISATVANRIDSVTDAVIAALPSIAATGEGATVEEIQDEVERQLMATGAYSVARRYILYREARARTRDEAHLRLRDLDGQEMLVNRAVLRNWISDAATDLGDGIVVKSIEEDVVGAVRNGMTLSELDRAIVLAGRSRIEQRPVYSHFAARALLRSIYTEVSGRRVAVIDTADFYAETFARKLREGVDNE